MRSLRLVIGGVRVHWFSRSNPRRFNHRLLKHECFLRSLGLFNQEPRIGANRGRGVEAFYSSHCLIGMSALLERIYCQRNPSLTIIRTRGFHFDRVSDELVRIQYIQRRDRPVDSALLALVVREGTNTEISPICS
ncbi:hypothetical protein CROQUDRAFT_107877 [Cronartium quercuum f. sp. fusiforme G11]|uniref:Uncharacterized protein n=1 Tax=Cronartium quercuum f. sp. fusiforme G11 TaxID=708437 RepID=A0A9P6TB66_9BASI|nr:hypothetical protein CROQUDRAFT_107877 [Cronartium quercuum f. sp. fusiforme G11]